MTASPDGVLIVDKSAGPTSHDVVAVGRRALGTSRVGHTGTLDPLATGVLVLVAGRATRLARFMANDEKEYEARVAFGRSTTTYDAEGATTGQTGRVPDRATLSALLASRVGAQLQTPPAYSAKKVGGEVAYSAARRDAPLTLRPVTVTVHALSLEAYDDGVATVRMRVSAGFYVRALAHELGEVLGTGAYLAGLRRTRAGSFDLGGAVGWEALATAARGTLAAALLPVDHLLPALPAATLTPEAARRVRHGQSVQAAISDDSVTGPVRLLDDLGHLLGIAEARPGPVGAGALRFLQPVVVLS
ncbi:MAG: tRNA pseudouridine(55) synthase TruB [Acidobacteria bacterium]|nr:tRNA pseudouridine(55) synthase TruB [Acidobacteriota bacterium]